MSFYIVLLLVNVACFTPLYLLNVRDAPNPFKLLLSHHESKWLRLVLPFYYRPQSTDPFRINFDFTFIVLLATAAPEPQIVVWPTAAVLALGFIEILYASVMQAIFKRAPMLASDIALLRSGLALAQRQIYWMAPATLAVLAAVALGSYEVTRFLFQRMPSSPVVPVAAALLLPAPCFYRRGAYSYAYLWWRSVQSPFLRLFLNIRYGRRVKRLLAKDARHFERHNSFKNVTLGGAPNVIVVCVESYGSVCYRDAGYAGGIRELLAERQRQLSSLGYRFASTHSDAPIFAGGSWLSYASFTYGLAVGDLQLFDGLFSQRSGFASYESLFHIFKRNGYENVLLCPLGGIDRHTVDWESLDRCFQSTHRLTFEDLDYVGPRVNYLGLVRKYSPLDQYSLCFGYEDAMRRSGGRPFTLFFCTLNSHYPWLSPTAAAADWRSLNDALAPQAVAAGAPVDRYAAAIGYQLDYLLRFTAERADDAPLVILFGDHQPPFITPEHMGKQTPVHVLSTNATLIDVLAKHGFAPTIDLTGLEPRAIRHEGFLSLLMNALNEAYGTNSGLDLPYRERGAALFDELELDAAPRAAQ